MLGLASALLPVVALLLYVALAPQRPWLPRQSPDLTGFFLFAGLLLALPTSLVASAAVSSAGGSPFFDMRVLLRGVGVGLAGTLAVLAAMQAI